MKNSADLGGCYPPRPSALVDNTLLDLQNSSYPTQPHSIIANYSMDVLFLVMIFLANSDISCLQTLTSHFFGIQICQPWNKRSHCFSSHLGSGWHINNDRNEPKNVIKDSEIIDQLIKRAYGNRAVRTVVKTVLSC